MRLLIDTHVWLWAQGDRSKLSTEVVDLISNADNEVLFSAASAWEIAIKAAIGKLRLSAPADVWIPQAMAVSPSVPLPVTHQHAVRVAQLPRHHADPFDHLLIAQAQVEGVPLISADRAFDKYEVNLIPAT